MRTIGLVLVILFLGACGAEEKAVQTPSGKPEGATEIPFAHTKTFKVYERDNYKIVDLRASVVSWGGGAQGGDQVARVVLAPKDQEAPKLTGDLQGAVLVRTPVERVAVNYGYLEAILAAIDATDRLVAVGGVKSYNDALRAKARAGELGQVGYGWHAPPEIDPLLASKPDVFLMVLGDLGHAEHYDRIKSLGVPVVPSFLDAEPGYMGGLDYVRLLGMFTGREEAAEDYVDTVTRNVERLKALVSDREPRTVLNAWYAGGGRWMATVRNADNHLMLDAGAINVLGEDDDFRMDDMRRIGSETLLEQARDAECWMIRDSHSEVISDPGYLQQFKAWRDGCLLAADGMQKPEADAYDIYERGLIRPDQMLSDMIRVFHPDVLDAEPVYIREHVKD